MPNKLFNLARMSTSTTGTGTITLGSAVSGYLSFSSAGVTNGAVVTYGIRDGSASEIGEGTYTSSGTTLSRDTILNSTNGGSAISLSGSAQVFITPSCQDLIVSSRMGNSLGLINGALSPTVGSNALTIAIKTRGGTDPSVADPVYVIFRNVTSATGDYTFLTLTAATSIVVSSGSTLGTANSTPFRIWVVGFNDGGTFRLGVITCTSNTGATIYPLAGQGIASSTAEGGAGAADSSGVFYTGTAVTSKAYTTLGYLTYNSGLSTAGTWDQTPTVSQLFGYGTPLPGDVIQRNYAESGGVQTGTTTVPNDDTIPQNTEGNEYFTCGITPTSPANVLIINAKITATNSNGSTGTIITSLFQDSTADAQVTAWFQTAIGTADEQVLYNQKLAGTSSAVTFKIRSGCSVAGTTTINGAASARKFGGALKSFLRVEEVMG